LRFSKKIANSRGKRDLGERGKIEVSRKSTSKVRGREGGAPSAARGGVMNLSATSMGFGVKGGGKNM